MKVLKVIVIILLVLAGLWIVLAAVAPAHLEIERSTTIDAPPSAVFAEVNCFDKWQAWSAWSSMNPTMENTYSENPCGLKAYNSWKGEKSGTGTQTIVEVTPNEYIKTELNFGGDPGIHISEWKFSQSDDGGTDVSWNFVGAESSFFFRPVNLMMKGVLKEAYDTGLANLKEVVEFAPQPETTYEVQTVDLPETHYLLVSGDVKPMDIGMYYAENFPMLMQYAAEAGAEVTGQPSGMYFNWTDTLAKMAAAVPVNKVVEGNDEIEFRTLEPGSALLIDYYGAYDEVGPAHYAIEDYSKENGVNLEGFAIETYITDPEEEPDTSKWLTKIIYPIAAAE